MLDLDATLFNIKIDSPKPREGSLLVAEPFLEDLHFAHAVIMLVDYAPELKSMGIVLNRSTRYTLGELVEGFNDDVDIPIYCGGPVDTDRMFYLHRMGEMFEGSKEIFPGLWIGGDYDQVAEYINEGNPTEGLIRFFIGYSGWDAGQLDAEMAAHTWAVCDRPLSPKRLLSGTDDAYWHKVLRTMGAPYRPWLLHPQNPGQN